MGKSLYIERLKEKLMIKSHIIIPLHGPKVTFDNVLQAFFKKMASQDSDQTIIFHLDISSSVRNSEFFY